MELTFGTYNLENGGIDGGSRDRLRRQLAMLKAAGAHVWALQECSHWDTNGALELAEAELGMRGYVAQSGRHAGGNLAVFIDESGPITVTGTRHEGLLNEERAPYWHGVAVVSARIKGYGPVRFASAHLSPASPDYRTIEAQHFQLITEKPAPLIVGGDWNAFPSYWPDPDPADVVGVHPEKVGRKKDKRAALALEAYMTDVAMHLGTGLATVGHRRSDTLAYPADRVYTTLPPACIKHWRIVREDNPQSDHRPGLAGFSLAAKQ